MSMSPVLCACRCRCRSPFPWPHVLTCISCVRGGGALRARPSEKIASTNSGTPDVQSSVRVPVPVMLMPMSKRMFASPHCKISPDSLKQDDCSHHIHDCVTDLPTRGRRCAHRTPAGLLLRQGFRACHIFLGKLSHAVASNTKKRPKKRRIFNFRHCCQSCSLLPKIWIHSTTVFTCTTPTHVPT